MNIFAWDQSGPAKKNARRWNNDVPNWAKMVVENYLGFTFLLILGPPALLVGRPETFWGYALFVIWGLLTYRRIPNLPTPQVAVVSIFDVRLPIVFQSFVFMIPFLKGIMNIEFVSMQRVDNDFAVDRVDARLETQVNTKEDENYYDQLAQLIQNTRSIKPPKFGGKVKIDVQAVLAPDASDPWAISNLIDEGNVSGATGIFDGKFSDVIRQIGRVLTPVEMIFMTDMITAYVYVTLTNVKGIPGQAPLFDYPTEERINEFLRWMRENSHARIDGSSLVLKSLYIPNISPIGRLAEVIENVGIEAVKRDTLALNTKALAENIAKLQGRSKDQSVSRLEALTALQLEDGKGTRDQKTIKFADAELLRELGPIIAAALSNRSGNAPTINIHGTSPQDAPDGDKN